MEEREGRGSGPAQGLRFELTLSPLMTCEPPPLLPPPPATLTSVP